MTCAAVLLYFPALSCSVQSSSRVKCTPNGGNLSMTSIAGFLVWSHSIPKPSETNLAFTDAALIPSLLPQPPPSPPLLAVLTWGLGTNGVWGEKTEYMLKTPSCFVIPPSPGGGLGTHSGYFFHSVQLSTSALWKSSSLSTV